MNRIKVKSSQVESVGYDPETQILEIEFKARKEGEPGSVYRYHDFSAADWTEFRQQESIGSYLNRHIKPNFRCSKVEPEVQVAEAGETPHEAGNAQGQGEGRDEKTPSA